ncbi:beta-N-acetylhexosaminidase [Proteiniphilum sp. UBA5480]|jgi:hexosaminidase|uniref:beta-N-acetylhexosaminidase n=2 Tax=Dysgonomonadaceae TaxID=2005520 RepID=UPI000E9F4F03|nr:beta-N-acetylhexosaminidase [Proteiniphilum sp. UBA5480]HBG56405.1 hypothetical protein [Porphyromonadaceae bacterium]HMM18233.1 beta-N-acetylhexosaminidase [Petrimonas sp.]
MKKLVIATFFILLTGVGYTQHNIIPHPSHAVYLQDAPFVLDRPVVILSDKAFLMEANLIASLIAERYRIGVRVGDKPMEGHAVISITKSDNPAKEQYQIRVNEKECVILASEGSGAFYGGITLAQMIRFDEAKRSHLIPSARIEDQPRFGWRGLMLDCSRTFIPVSYIKKTLDRMAFYKLNVLHLHLTDDQGWRLEIKKRLTLTAEGASFSKTAIEPDKFEGYYTQDDIRNLVVYAALRHIQIVPEIEVPGHSGAAIHAYPDLSCSKEKVPIYPFIYQGAEKPNDVFCAGNEGTYSFFEDVLNEVEALFPSIYVHLGGDEVSKHHWSNCETCQKKKKELRIDNENQLQCYVMDRVGKHVTEAKKRPIGWDEIVQGDISKDWIVMGWRDESKGREALQKGYEVVMTPHTHLYFDYSYATTPTSKVYAYNPVPDGLTTEQESRILGIQANFWSHIDRWTSRIDFQLYPRILALSERAWSDASVNDYETFRQRVKIHKKWLQFFKTEYNDNEL